MHLLSTLSITEICHIHTTMIEAPSIRPMTDRAWFGLSFAKSGKNIYHHNGKEYLSDPQHGILFPMHASYVLECRESGQFTLVNFLCADDFSLEEFVSIPINNNDYFLRNHTRMERLAMFQNPNNRPRILALFYDTIANLQENTMPSRHLPILRPAIQYMTDHLEDETLCNTQIAACLDISEVYFRKLFKEEYGVAPMQYLQQLRITRAKEMLISSATPVSLISAACGYSSIYHFCRIFKEKTGYTPTEYRNHYRNMGL